MNIAARTAADTEAMASPVGEEDFRLAVLNAVLVSDQRFQGSHNRYRRASTSGPARASDRA